MYIAVQKVEWQHIAERFHTCMPEHTYHTQFTQSAKNVSSKDVQAFSEPFRGPIHSSLFCFPDISVGALINLGDYMVSLLAVMPPF